MTYKIVPVVIESTREIIGTARISPVNSDGRISAILSITNTELLKQHKGLIKILLEEEKVND